MADSWGQSPGQRIGKALLKTITLPYKSILKFKLPKSTHIHVVSMSVGREVQVVWGIVRWVSQREIAYFLWLYWGRLVLSVLVHVWSHFMCYYYIQSFHSNIRGRWGRATIATSAHGRSWGLPPEGHFLAAPSEGFWHAGFWTRNQRTGLILIMSACCVTLKITETI